MTFYIILYPYNEVMNEIHFQRFSDDLGRDQNVEHQDHRTVGAGLARQVGLEVVQPEEGGGHHEPVRTEHAQITVRRGGINLLTLKVNYNINNFLQLFRFHCFNV